MSVAPRGTGPRYPVAPGESLCCHCNPDCSCRPSEAWAWGQDGEGQLRVCSSPSLCPILRWLMWKLLFATHWTTYPAHILLGPWSWFPLTSRSRTLRDLSQTICQHRNGSDSKTVGENLALAGFHCKLQPALVTWCTVRWHTQSEASLNRRHLLRPMTHWCFFDGMPCRDLLISQSSGGSQHMIVEYKQWSRHAFPLS